MKIRIGFTIDIDPTAWAEEYGLSPRDVKQDVQDHIRNMAVEYVAGLGLLKD